MHSNIRDAAIATPSASFAKRTKLAAAFGFALLATTVMTPVQAFAEEKIALVVGNSQYRKVTRLTNPANDSTDVAASLRRLGFNVKHLMDLDFDGFRRAIIDFGNEAKTADMAVIFYAGHGAEIDGKNWLIPVDAEIKSEINVYAEAINLEMLIDISVMPKVVGLIVLDACRNNPFVETIAASAGRSIVATNRATLSGPSGASAPGGASYSAASIPTLKSNAPAAAPIEMIKNADGTVTSAEALEPPGHGLAPVEPADNVLVAFSAAAGTTANDGTGRNSPYSSALLRHVETPGLEINYLFRNVHDDVIEETKQQQPALYGTLSKDEIFFRPGDERAVAAYNDQEAEKLAWPFIRATNDINVLRKFVEQFPASARIGEVNARITQLEGAEKFAWTIVERQNTASAYRAFSELYPYSERVETARTMMASLDNGSASDAAVDLPRPPAATYSLSSAIPEKKSIRQDTASVEKAWQILQSSRDQDVVMSFAESFPSAKRRQAVAERFRRTPKGADGAQPFASPTQWMLNTANDAEVNECFRGRSDATGSRREAAASCLRAIERYPDFVQLRFQLCKTAGRPDDCLRDAVEDAREQGFLTSAYTRSAREKVRNQQYQAVRRQVEQAASNAASNAASAAASAASSAAASAAASAASMAASSAASSAAGRINVPTLNIAPVAVPRVAVAPVAAPAVRIQSAGRFNSQLASLKATLAPTAPAVPVAAPSAPVGTAAAIPNAPGRVIAPTGGAAVIAPGARGTPALVLQSPGGVRAPGGPGTPALAIQSPAGVRAPGGPGAPVLSLQSPAGVRAPGAPTGPAVAIQSPAGVRVPTGAPAVNVPATSVPAAAVPNVRVNVATPTVTPNVSVPAVSVPTSVPNVKVNVPTVTPNVRVNVATPTVTPNVRVPAVTVPTSVPNVKVNVPTVTPNVKVNVPNVKVSVPNVKVNVPNVKVPSVKVPQVKVTAPAVTVPTVRVPR